MTDDKDLDAWGEGLAENNAPAIGANKELIRKAMQLNPALRNAAMTSTEVLNQLAGAKPAAVPAVAAARSLTDVVADLRKEREERKRAIAAQRAQLEKEERELDPLLCERFIDAVLAVDPHMTSLKTAHIMQQEKALLDAIGFSAQKLVAREAKKR
jgi:hypothetical protein